MKRHIYLGSGDKRQRPGISDYLDRLLRRSPLSGHQRRWQVLQRLACSVDQYKE